jgi:hypothetical protein
MQIGAQHHGLDSTSAPRPVQDGHHSDGRSPGSRALGCSPSRAAASPIPVASMSTLTAYSCGGSFGLLKPRYMTYTEFPLRPLRGPSALFQ